MKLPFVAVGYVDVGIYAGPRKLLDTVFHKLHQLLDVTGLGELKDFLGMHIIKDRVAGTLAVH